MLVQFKLTGISVNPPNILAASVANVDVAIPEVKVGDFVDMQPPETLEGGLVPQGATVPVNGTLRVRISNPTAGAIDGAALLWNFIITRFGIASGEGISWAG